MQFLVFRQWMQFSIRFHATNPTARTSFLPLLSRHKSRCHSQTHVTGISSALHVFFFFTQTFFLYCFLTLSSALYCIFSNILGLEQPWRPCYFSRTRWWCKYIADPNMHVGFSHNGVSSHPSRHTFRHECRWISGDSPWVDSLPRWWKYHSLVRRFFRNFAHDLPNGKSATVVSIIFLQAIRHVHRHGGAKTKRF